MKNLYDANGMPLPVAKSDVKAQMLKLALSSFEQGLDAACDCMAQAFRTAIEAGHESLKLQDGLVLVEELRKIAKAQANEKKP